MNEYLSGQKLYGDDFSADQIKQWFEEESEGYADLGSKDYSKYSYSYHLLNKILGFNRIKELHFTNALGFGSAWGHEFEPIISKISQLTIIEPSYNLVSEKIGNIVPQYIKPQLNGLIPLENNTYDLITCFGTLHHIPNFTTVTKELIRILKPGGIILIREPINSMGDWNFPRKGLTKNERGIPVAIFDQLLKNESVSILSKKYCLTMTYQFQTKIGKLFSKPLIEYRLYIYFDKLISFLTKWNYNYHSIKWFQRVAPSSIFYVLKKNS